jgi:hypothetical protein
MTPKPDWQVLCNEGIAHFHRDEFDAAVKSFQGSIEAGGGTPEVRCLLAHGLHRAGQSEKAISGLKEIIDAAPDFSPAHDGLIGILRSLDRMNEAASFLTWASYRHPSRLALRRVAARSRRETGGRWNRISILDSSVFSVQDVVPLLLGDKPVAYNNATAEERAFVPEWAKHLGLFAVDLGEVKANAQHDKKTRYGVLISKNRRLLDKTARVWPVSDDSSNVDIGRLLGYPDCCVSAYKKFQRLQKTEPTADAVRFIAAASGAGPYPYLLNNILVFNSLRCSADAEGIQRLFNLNSDQNIALKLKAAITWHPCSFHCGPSLAAARRSWAYLQRYSPVEAAALKDRLDKPVLYFDWSRFVAFEGAVEGNVLRYSRIVPPHSFLSPEHLELFRSGDSLHLVPRGVSVRRGGKVLRVLPAQSPLILPFSSKNAILNR